MKYLALLLVLFGCYTQKKASREVSKAMQTYPAVVAEICAKEFPTRVTKSDTIVYENIVEIECPDSTVVTTVINRNDTLIITEVKKEKVFVKSPCETVYITEHKIDSAALAACILEHDMFADNAASAISKLNGKVKFWQGVSIALFLIALVLGFLLGRKFR